MNLQLNKDSSFNRSFERENGYSNMLLLGHNKKTSDFSLFKGNSFVKNSSINMPHTQFHKEKNNIFIDMAEENNDNNNDVINITLYQGDKNSIIRKPFAFRDQSAISQISMNVQLGDLNNQPSVIGRANESKPSPLLSFKKESS